ncbi:MAG TPA: hypothetical protein VMC03_17060 [Streptosporangiaceae bacterium]|nr:hypothetical protein [Streptosporangiaceae bacterium]
MSEIERRLRAAMHAAVDDLTPPVGLLEQVGARRRRRRAASAAAAVVAAAVLAVPAVTLALHGRGAAGGGMGAPSAGLPAPVARAAPGTVLEACDNAVGENLGLDWRRESVHVGPLWFIDLRQQSATYYGQSRVAIGGLAVAVQDNAKAWVTTTGAARSFFRFLFGPTDMKDGVDGRYTVANGEAGVTFVGCPAGQAWAFQAGYTVYGGYFLIAGSPRRVSLDVWMPAKRRPTRITFEVGY